jgi:hypothetical protein
MVFQHYNFSRIRYFNTQKYVFYGYNQNKKTFFCKYFITPKQQYTIFINYLKYRMKRVVLVRYKSKCMQTI